MRERKPVSMKVDVGARAVVGSGMAKRAEENAAEENAARRAASRRNARRTRWIFTTWTSNTRDWS